LAARIFPVESINCRLGSAKVERDTRCRQRWSNRSSDHFFRGVAIPENETTNENILALASAGSGGEKREVSHWTQNGDDGSYCLL
jgi:hypothetical protein